jgi:hypothetical protein
MVKLLIGFMPDMGCVLKAVIKAEEEDVASGLLESLNQ